MLLREIINRIKGLQYITGKLDLRSGIGKTLLWEIPWNGEAAAVENGLRRLDKAVAWVRCPEHRAAMGVLRSCLGEVKDIRGTLSRLREGKVLDDLELFEVKGLALAVRDLRQIEKVSALVVLPDLSAVADMLDPEHTGMRGFYVYDAYSGELAALRAAVRQEKQKGDEEKAEKLYFTMTEEEDRIRGDLSRQLKQYSDRLEEALKETAGLDLLVAKALLAEEMKFCRPCIEESGKTIAYKKLFHPQIKERLQEEGRDFQAVDIRLEQGGTLITGANMSGKSVLLKSLALAQALAQLGFYVPAEQASLVPVKEVLCCLEDRQDEMKGLSSFAAEMMEVNRIIQRVKEGYPLLVLIDELARTTNPSEGRALVNGVLEILSDKNVWAVVTTHYNGICAPCRRWRVRGFREEEIEGILTLENIGRYMDYRLTEEAGEEVPREALRIAEILGVEKELTERARNFLEYRKS